jgi:AICAR transformylase/IMP cyclohydrolase PurH
MSIKDDLIKYFSQFQDSSGGYGINPQQTTAKFGEISPVIPPQGTAGFNQLNTMQNAMSNPIDAQKALDLVAKNDNKGAMDMGKQLVAKGLSSMGGGKQMAQPALKIINAQQAFAQMPDATQPQQVQEFKPEQMAMMLRRRNGY